jgi:hypothetical protein
MSATKRLLQPHKVINGGDCSGNIQGDETNVENIDVVMYEIITTGSPVGVVQFEFLNAKRNVESDVDSWKLIEFGVGTDLPISGVVADSVVIQQNPFYKIRPKYVRTSGTGTLNITIFGKEE